MDKQNNNLRPNIIKRFKEVAENYEYSNIKEFLEKEYIAKKATGTMMCKVLGVSTFTFYKLIRSHDMPLPVALKGLKRLKDVDLARVAKMRKEGKIIRLIAVDQGCSPDLIFKACRLLGLPKTYNRKPVVKVEPEVVDVPEIVVRETMSDWDRLCLQYPHAAAFAGVDVGGIRK